ncbi:MAG TPA: GNAT family N-acetyltransferase [Tepidisphaeraceae bacterium]|nr:GNAT family N-acetyltransferase [Tepidisphaeraceae bacterium]
MTIHIRPANSSDAQTIAHFNTAMAMETEGVQLDVGTILAGVQAGLSDATKARYFAAEIDGRVVGCCMITHEWSDWRNGDMWWLQSVYVAPDYRRTGVFREMYKHVQSAARAAGAVVLRLYVERDNIRAKQTYESLGMYMTHYDVMEAKLTMLNDAGTGSNH